MVPTILNQRKQGGGKNRNHRGIFSHKGTAYDADDHYTYSVHACNLVRFIMSRKRNKNYRLPPFIFPSKNVTILSRVKKPRGPSIIFLYCLNEGKATSAQSGFSFDGEQLSNTLVVQKRKFLIRFLARVYGQR